MAEIVCSALRKVYPDGTVALENLDLAIEDGELMVLVGPSGCGKTTLLRLIAGLEEVTDGTICIGTEIVNDVPARDRDIGMVFQSYALYPHMTVRENIGFGLKLRRARKNEIDRAVQSAAAKLGLSDLLDRKPRQLSGGQRQRVAMGRAIVRRPEVFLMDEPLSNLDAKLRVQMRGEIGRLQRDLGVTTVYVTHDQTEAMTLGDRVAVMRHGVLQQLGDPQTLYRAPVNLFVAGFIGSPAMNLVQAVVRRADGEYKLQFGSISVDLPPAVLEQRPDLTRYEDRQIVAGIRPEHILDLAESTSGTDHAFPALVELREEMGSETFIYFTVDAQPVFTEDMRELAADTDQAALEDLREGVETNRTPFVARVSPDTRAEVGKQMDLVINARAIHFFDPVTGSAIPARSASALSEIEARAL